MAKVIIGVDPRKLSATIEVVDQHEKLLGSGRVGTEQAGYFGMRFYAKNWPDRAWAIEGSNGAGRPLAQRLLEAEKHVVDVPAKARGPGAVVVRHRSQPEDRRAGRALDRGGRGPHQHPPRPGGGR